MQDKNLHTPELRFPEFHDDWQVKKLGEICISELGKTRDEGRNTGTLRPYLCAINVLWGKIDLTTIKQMPFEDYELERYLVKKGDLLVCEGGEIGRCAIYNYDEIVYYQNALHRVRFLENYDSVFFMNLLCYYNILGIIERNGKGSTIKHLNQTALKAISVCFPTLPEQRKIALCLSSLDDLIKSVGDKIELLKQHKKGLMQKLFPKKDCNVPELRFPEFSGDWQVKRLGEIFIERNEHSVITKDLPLLSFTIEEGIIYPENKKTNKRDFLIKDKDNKKYLIVRHNDILYNPANVIYGAIHRNDLCDGVVSPIYKIFYTKQDALFMGYYVRKNELIQRMTVFMEGSVQKLKTLKPESFLKLDICIPSSIAEQRKIAECLSSLDAEIEQYEQKLQMLEQHKKGLMQRMFVKM